ncbi:MAG: hypothetical protein BGO26_15170 [Actinobacteria bacterium 69-20]|jgi:hypothetical protein|nr:MAG: hypothetical protein BGO26_15170 [Actinobacteria bacterium 69-20]
MIMTWWQWTAAAVEAVLLTILVLLWFDTLRERQWPARRARHAAGYAAIIIPVGFVVVLMLPLWIALILIAVPALAIVAMALAS